MTNAQIKSPPQLTLLLCLSCALLPFIAVHWAYLLAASDGQVPWCIPYIDSCTSISATGRKPPASFVFRGLMLPSAAFMLLYWWLHWYWLRGVLARSGRCNSMLALSWLACVGLVLYVTVLGEAGDLWRLQRKIGTVLFFSFTFLAQLLLAADLRTLPTAVHPQAQAVGGRLLRLCQLMLVMGVFSVVVELISENWHDEIEDAIEWQLALLLQLNFLFSAALWRRGEWQLVFEQNPE